MSTLLLKRCYKHILRPLTMAINKSLTTEVSPASLKSAIVIPIHKKDDWQTINNYGSVSIIPVFSKVFEKMFLNQFSRLIEKHIILSTDLFGFRAGRSTLDVVTSLFIMVVEGIESKQRVPSVFLNLSKAFNCMDHSILLAKFERFGIQGSPLLWIRSFLAGRHQAVQVSNKISSPQNKSP